MPASLGEIGYATDRRKVKRNIIYNFCREFHEHCDFDSWWLFLFGTEGHRNDV